MEEVDFRPEVFGLRQPVTLLRSTGNTRLGRSSNPSFVLEFGWRLFLPGSFAMDWDPSRFFRATGSVSPYALLVLNQPINEKAFGVLNEHGEAFPIGTA